MWIGPDGETTSGIGTFLTRGDVLRESVMRAKADIGEQTATSTARHECCGHQPAKSGESASDRRADHSA
jgi:hypothetical protein